MARRVRQRTVFRQAEGPTVERAAKSDAETIEAPRIPGADNGNFRTVRFVSRAVRWHRDGWIDEQQRRAFDEWERLNDSCHWHPQATDLTRSRSGAASRARPEAIGEARARCERIGRLMVAECGHFAVWTVFEWLTTVEPVRYTETFAAGERDARRRAQSMIRRVAAALVFIISR